MMRKLSTYHFYQNLCDIEAVRQVGGIFITSQLQIMMSEANTGAINLCKSMMSIHKTPPCHSDY